MSHHAYRFKFDPVTRRFGTDKKYFGTLPNREGKEPKKRGCKPHPDIPCMVCYGAGQRKDAHTGKLRPCLICKGTGKIDRPQKNLP